MFNSILSDTTASISVGAVLVCILVSLLLGLCIAFVHMKTSKYNKNFIVTLAILPLLVQVVMLMVNGNLGTSVAVLGAFSLIRFRSIPGNSREIASIFLAMGIGLCVGMGQVYFAILLTFIVSVVLLIFYKTKFGDRPSFERNLKILIPEDLDYENVFNDCFMKYVDKASLEQVKTTNMGSMFELSYVITLKKNISEKSFIDDLRVKNGNLKIVLTHPIVDISL